MLAETYGHDTIDAMLRDYLATYRYKIAGPGEVLTSFENSLEVDLDIVFEEWIGSIASG
jgi:hypothetical protein